MFNLHNSIFQRLTWKAISVYFLCFHYWILKEWKAAKVENHYVSAYYLHKWMAHILTRLVVLCLFFVCEIPKYMQAKNRLTHLD